MKWTKELELELLEIKSKNKTVAEVAIHFQTTPSAIKHKLRRIGQSTNDERYTHPEEKTDQILRVLPRKKLHVLETHAGFGNLTQVYQSLGHEVLAIEIDQSRCDEIKKLNLEDIDVIQADSLNEMLFLEYKKLWFDVVDLDPYGLPSRYIPSALRLINDGFLLMTMPKVGVTQMNKITVKHLEAFWDIKPKSKPNLEEVVAAKMETLAFQNFRRCQVVDVVDLGRMFRFAFRVEKVSMVTLSGLTVNRNPTIVTSNSALQTIPLFDLPTKETNEI
jgi:SAM-dependent methyltransferase